MHMFCTGDHNSIVHVNEKLDHSLHITHGNDLSMRQT
jgi:hypothetical protein